MKRSYLPLMLTLSLWMGSAPAGAGYRELTARMEAYRPPAYLTVRPDPGEPTVETADQTAFRAAIGEIQALKRERMRDADFTGSDRFFQPDPALRSRLAAAATDTPEAVAVLSGRFSLSDLMTLSLLRNPGIRAAEHRFRAAVETFDQVSYLDEILRQYSAFTEGVMPGVGPMKGADPGAGFPFPGVASLKGQVVDQEVKSAGESLEITRRDAVSAAARMFWEFSYIRAAQRITAKMIQFLNNLESVAITRYESGRTSFQDVIKIRINRETELENLVSLAELQRNMETRIRQLTDLPETVRIGEPTGGDPPLVETNLARLTETAMQRRQELQQLHYRIGKLERMIEMAETMILPRGYSLGLADYADEAIRQSGTGAVKPSFATGTTASTGAGLPRMPWFGMQDAYLSETRKKLSALREELNNAELATVAAVREAWYDLDRALRERRLYGNSVVRLSQTALDVSSRAYEAGSLSFADVINSYTLWLNSSLAWERRRANVGIAVAELSRTVGVSLVTDAGAATIQQNREIQ